MFYISDSTEQCLFSFLSIIGMELVSHSSIKFWILNLIVSLRYRCWSIVLFKYWSF